MISVMGVAYLPIIEKPLSIYYKSEITHTTQHYSYKPGQSGTAFEFYIKRNDAGYEQLDFFNVFAIPTLFYAALLISLNLLWLLVKKKDPDPKDDRWNDSGKKAMNFVFTRKSKKMNIILFIFLVGIVLFFACARSKKFGLGTPDSITEASQSSFHPTNLAYGGGDLIWLIELNRQGNGAALIQNEKANINDSVYMEIKCFQLSDSTYQDINSYHLDKEYYQLETYAVNNEVWLMTRPDHLLVYDAKNTNLIFEDAKSFAEQFDELELGINEMYKINFHGELLNIEAMNGVNYYYDFESKKLNENISLFNKKDLDKFELKKVKGEIYNVYHKNSKGVLSKCSENDLIKADLLYQDSAGAIILHYKDISDNAERTISFYTSSGDNNWNIENHQLPVTSSQNKFVKTDLVFQCSKYDNQLIITISSLLQSEGILSVDYTTGSVNWNFALPDFNLN